MTKRIVSLVNIIMLVALIAGCGSDATEKEYFDLAYKFMGEEQWSDAEKNFQNILDKYPEGEFAAKSLFMVGFVNANYLMNYEKAKKYYGDFLKKYPNHELADDAKYEIDNLGKSIDDLPFLQDGRAPEDSVTASLN